MRLYIEAQSNHVKKKIAWSVGFHLAPEFLGMDSLRQSINPFETPIHLVPARTRGRHDHVARPEILIHLLALLIRHPVILGVLIVATATRIALNFPGPVDGQFPAPRTELMRLNDLRVGQQLFSPDATANIFQGITNIPGAKSAASTW